VKLILGIARTTRAGRSIELTDVNGEPGLSIRINDELLAVVSIAPVGDRISAVYVVLNPQKLGRGDVTNSTASTSAP
jgi:hypothetical protein